MKPRRLHYTTRVWFQLTMMPAIILVSLGLSWSVYQSLRRIILRSFEQKLGAVSTTTAAFIKPEDHEVLMQQPNIVGLAFSPQGMLLALDSSREVLMHIRPENGVAEDRVLPVPPKLRDLAFDRAAGTLTALELPSGRVFELDPDTGKAKFRIDLGPKAQAISPGPGGSLLAITDRLLKIDLTENRVSPVSDQPLPKVLGSGYDPDRNVIVAITTDRHFAEIDPATGKLTLSAALAEDAPVPGDMAYDRRRHIMLGAYKSILRVDPVSGKIEPAHFLAAFGQELSPTYRKYLRPMRQIMNELDLTYLYTQIVIDRTKIIYGIDATQGEGHSPLHSEDKIPDEEVDGVQELMRSGALYHSPVTKWEQWGYLKGSLAPIFDGTGRVVAMAGADVEVSIIERQTRQALIELLLIGVGLLILASSIAIVVARRVRRPLEQIKSTALDVAAGNYDRRIQLKSPREAHALAEAFNQMAASLEANMNALHSSIRDLLRNRDRYELARRLGQPHDPASVLGAIPDVTVAWRDPVQSPGCASGAVRHGDRVVVWFAQSPADTLEAARVRADLAHRVSARLQTAHDEENAIPLPGQTVAPFAVPAPAVKRTLPSGVMAAVLIDLVGHTARVLTTPGFAINDRHDGLIRLSGTDLTVELRGFLATTACV